MISYREKQLLMTMKMLQDKTVELASQTKEALSLTEQGLPMEIALSKEQPIESFEELCQKAENEGYDIWIRPSDILTADEIDDLKCRKDEIESQFKDLVKLREADYAFLASAVLLQIAKQLIIKMDLSPHSQGASETDEAFSEKYDNPQGIDGTERAKRYYAPVQQIENTKTVPFDIVAGTKYFGGTDKETGLGLSAKSHRFKSVGHDPILGLYYGTANILTNTATFYHESSPNDSEVKKYLNKLGMLSFHVRYEDMARYEKPYISSYASRILLDERVVERFQNERSAVWLALKKEIEHISSDQESIAGIPIPFISLVLGSKRAQDLAAEGFDWDHLLKNAAVVGKQVSATLLINAIIVMLHRLYLVWDQVKAADSLLDAAIDYMQADVGKFDQIRTKKLVLYSNLIASTVNLGVCVGGGVITTKAGNAELVKRLFSHLDIGGVLVTLTLLLKDGLYILKAKDDFIKAAINEDFAQKLKEVEDINMLTDGGVIS